MKRNFVFVFSFSLVLYWNQTSSRPPWSREGNSEDCRYWVYGKAPPLNPLSLSCPPRFKGRSIQKNLFKYIGAPYNITVVLDVLPHSPPFLCLSYSMTIDTVELRKIQYAQELAAYTMRQWMLTRDSPDPKHGSVPDSTSGPTSAA